MSTGEPIKASQGQNRGCYVDGCQATGEVVVHFNDNPRRHAAFCSMHAAVVARSVPLIASCTCVFCHGARRLFLGAAE